jgi:hypothetical protein
LTWKDGCLSREVAMSNLMPLLLAQPHGGKEAMAAGILAFGCFFWVLLMLLMVAFPIFCFWKIFTKAGHNGAMALLCLIPGVGVIIVLCILAFGDWPILRNRQ